MLRFATAVGVLALSAGASEVAMGQQCSNGFRPFVRTHNFLSPPAQMPRRSLGLWPDARPHPTGGPTITRQLSNGYRVRQQGFVAHPSHLPAHVPASRGEFRHPAQCFDGASLNIQGQVQAGDASLALSLNSGVIDHRVPHVDHPFKDCGFSHKICQPVVSSWWGAWWWYDDEPNYPIEGPVVVYQTALPEQGQTAEAPPEPEVELTEAQRAALLLRTGDVAQAISVLQSHLNTEPNDAEAMRLLALALVAEGRVREGAAMMSFAYGADRSLAQRPLGASNLASGERGLREAVRQSVDFAHAEDSASAWLLVSVLMQAEGRSAPAQRMLERAFEAGLDQRVYTPMQAALGG